MILPYTFRRADWFSRVADGVRGESRRSNASGGVFCPADHSAAGGEIIQQSDCIALETES